MYCYVSLFVCFRSKNDLFLVFAQTTNLNLSFAHNKMVALQLLRNTDLVWVDFENPHLLEVNIGGGSADVNVSGSVRINS
jgi:hypothetical protein